MGTLTQCMRRAGKALDASDAAEIKKIRDELRAEGMPEAEAAREAISAQIGSTLDARNAILKNTSVDPDALPQLRNYSKYEIGVNEKKAGYKSSEPSPSSLPSAIKLANSKTWQTGRDIKVVMQDAVKSEAEAKGIDLQDNDYLAGRVVEDARESLKDNADAIGWYDRTVAKALRVLATIHPEIASDKEAEFAFKYALAVTSNGLKVDKNFQLAEKAYKHWKENGVMPTDVGIGTAKQGINSGMAYFNEAMAEHGPVAFREFMTTKSTVGAIQKETGIDIGGENVGTEVFGAAVIGPKIGNGFLMNLYGEFGQLTMDRWLMASWGRWTGTLIEDKSAQSKKGAKRLQDAIRGLSAAEKRTVKDVIGIAPAIGNAEEVAFAIQKATQKTDKRARISETDALNELRKAGNSLAGNLDAQKLVPANGAERNKIREVFGQALAEMQSDPKLADLTMADLQAILWYSEKRLYDSARAATGAKGYQPSEAPDYANAAVKLAKELGIEGKIIEGASDGRTGNAGQGATGTQEEGRPGGTQEAAGEAAQEGESASVGEPVSSYERVTPSDVYEDLETRPDTNPQQEAAGRSALRDLLRRLDRIVAWRPPSKYGDASSTLLASRLAAGFREGKPSQLVGQKASSPEDLAAIAQVYRDPRFETLRFVFTKKGKVVGERAYSSRMPAAVSFGDPAAMIESVQDQLMALGADGYYIMHNHPSGNSGPSPQDVNFTFALQQRVPGFLEHVVIDFNEYSVIGRDGSVNTFEKDMDATDFYANPEVDSDLLGRSITSEQQAGEVAREVADPSRPVVILTNARGNVQVVTSISPETLEVLDDEDARSRRVMAALRGILREAGAGGNMFLVLPEEGVNNYAVVREAGADLFKDIFGADGRSLSPYGGMDVNDALNKKTFKGVEERLAGLPQYVEVDGKKREFKSFKPAQDAAKKYMKKKGMPYAEPDSYVEVDEARATRIANEFDLMQHNPSGPEVKASYDAMIEETLDQYQAILDTGLTVNFIKGSDPYGNPRNAILDVIENNNLFVFPTTEGFGSSDLDVSDNPLLAETKFKTSDGDPMLANDVFRVVHDYFGHIKNGVGFRARGEENAWQSHAAMYSPLARRAMTTETRGQNSWVNYGPNAEFNRTASGADTVYADQKIGLLPVWVSEEGRESDRLRRDRPEYKAGLEGAIFGGRLQLSHFSRKSIQRTDPSKAGSGLDRGVSGTRYLPKATYFGITQADEDGYRRETGLGSKESRFSIAPELIYPLDENPLDFKGSYKSIIEQLQANGFSGLRRNVPDMGKVAVVWDPLQSDSNPDDILFRETKPMATRNPRRMSADRVSEIVDQMPGAMRGNVSVIADSSSLPDYVQDAMKRQGVSSIAGYYNRSTDEVFIVASAMRSAKDVQVTVLHEAIGHRGIERVMGSNMNEFLGLVRNARSSDPVIADAFSEIERLYPGASPTTQAAEVVARISESDPKHSLVQRVIQWMRQALRQLGFNVMFSNNDIIEALRRAKNAAPGSKPNDAGILFSSDVTSLDEAREKVNLEKFRKSFMEKIGEGVADTQARVDAMTEAGAFHGFEVGDRFSLTTPSGHVNQYKVTGKGVRKPMAHLDAPDDMIFYRKGEEITPFIYVEANGGESKSMLQVSGIVGRKDLVRFGSPLSSVREDGAGYSNRDRWREQNKTSQRMSNTPEQRANAEALRDGDIDTAEYVSRTRKTSPIRPMTEVPTPATYDEMYGALKTNQLDQIMRDGMSIPEGTPIGSRLDITAYDNFDVWVVTAHDGTKSGGSVQGYLPTAILKDVEFSSSPKGALNVATGKTAKAPFARMMGSWSQHMPEDAAKRAKQAMKSKDWVQVGMNPYRHSFFYDKATGEPVASADEVIQVGALVMAKNPKYTDVTDEQFRVGMSDIFFKAEEVSDRSPQDSGFSVPDETLTESAIRKMQDKFLQLNRLQKAIKGSGGKLTEENDAYLAEELFHGKAENDIRIMRETYVQPLAEKMAEFGISHAELDKYLYAMHAPERNAHIASINDQMPDGGSGMTDLEAGRILARIRQAGQMEQMQELATFARGMLDAQREMIISGGLEDDGTVQAWQEKYKHYVPLKGWAEDTKDQGIPRVGQGFNIRGNESKRALGRSSEAASPLSYTIVDLTEKIIRARKNEVGNTLLKLIEDNPNADYWEVFDEDNPETDRKLVKRKNPETGLIEERVEERTMNMWGSDDYFTTKREGKTYFMKLKDPLLMRAMKSLGPQGINSVLQASAYFNRFMSAVNTSYAPEFVISNFARDYQTAFLNLNAEQSLGEKGKTAGEKININLKRVLGSMGAIHGALRGKKAKSEEGRKIQEWYEEYRATGAQTGYFDRKDIDGQAKELDALVQMASGGFAGNARLALENIKTTVDNLNQSVENAVRLAAYISGREEGLSAKQAASLAKNMTVNFNRRGEIGTTLNALYMFANASIQGTANFARTMLTLKDEGKGLGRLNNAQKLAVVLVAGSYGIAALNRMAAGDDDDGENWYDKVPGYVRERNLVIMKSVFGGPQDGSYVKIPLPYGYNVFHVLGEGVEGAVSGGRSVGNVGTDMTLAVLGSFSPIGFSDSNKGLDALFLKNAAFTPIKPFVELAYNENFAGSPIYRENFPFGTPKPDSSLGKRSTPAWAEWLAKSANTVTGGNEWQPGAVDVNPDIMDYMVDFFTGSAGAFVNKSIDFGTRAVQGVEQDAGQTPFLRRLSGKVLPYDDQGTFYQRRDKVMQANEAATESKGDERRQIREENADLLKMRSKVKQTENKLKIMRKKRDRIYENESLSAKEKDERLKVIEAEMETVVDEFNRVYAEKVGRLE